MTSAAQEMREARDRLGDAARAFRRVLADVGATDGLAELRDALRDARASVGRALAMTEVPAAVAPDEVARMAEEAREEWRESR